jgi:hypothetical protein
VRGLKAFHEANPAEVETGGGMCRLAAAAVVIVGRRL